MDLVEYSAVVCSADAHEGVSVQIARTVTMVVMYCGIVLAACHAAC